MMTFEKHHHIWLKFNNKHTFKFEKNSQNSILNLKLKLIKITHLSLYWMKEKQRRELSFNSSYNSIPGLQMSCTLKIQDLSIFKTKLTPVIAHYNSILISCQNMGFEAVQKTYFQINIELTLSVPLSRSYLLKRQQIILINSVSKYSW